MQRQNCEGLTVVYQPISILRPYSGNARTHSKHQIRQIAKCIREFGFTNPVLIDRHNRIIAGHGRVEAAKLLGMTEVPTICLENLSEQQIQAYVIADNRLAEKAGWDKSILAIELQHLLTINADFDITLTGFEMPEIDLILHESEGPRDKDDVVEADEQDPSVTQPGDHWMLSKHHVLCASAIQRTSYATLMGNRRADVVFIDPPYNVAIDGHASGNGSVRHRDFVMASGEMTEVEYFSFLTASFRLLTQYSVPGSIHFVCIDWRHVAELLAAGGQAYDELLNLCVWVKNNGGMGSFYRSRHELICVFKNGKGKHRNNIQLGQYGRNRTNVWEYPAASTFSKSGEEGKLLALHPTVKPVALVADALLDCSARGDVVLDTFLGSGTTLIAAERVGRLCYAVELDPRYVDTAIRRWQRYTGDHAVLAESGRRFEDVAVERREVTRG
jgi:DNA modification methylase